jgi:hypothetical protein
MAATIRDAIDWLAGCRPLVLSPGFGRVMIDAAGNQVEEVNSD